MLNLQIPIHIADGSLTKKNRSIIQDFQKKNKRLNIDYKYYGKDSDLNAFFRKTTNAINYINSEYVIFTCNDDFLIEGSIKEGEKFLEKNKEYVAAAGPVYDTTMCQTKPKHNQIWGILSHPINQYPSFNLTSDKATERLYSYLSNRKSSYIWSALHRKDSILKTNEDIIKINPIDLRFQTHLTVLLTISRGKISGTMPCMTIHQSNNSESAGSKNSSKWYDWIQHKDWLNTYESMIDAITSVAVKNESYSYTNLRRKIEYLYQGLIGELILRSIYPSYLQHLYKIGERIKDNDAAFNVYKKINEMVPNFQKKNPVKRSIKSKSLMFIKKFITKKA